MPLLRSFLESFGVGWLSSVGLEHIDLQLVSLLEGRRNGFFVEAGANDGINQSNTYYLEKILGWRGLLIEALPAKAALCRKNRPKSDVHNVALTRSGGPSEVIIEDANLMSIVNDGVLSMESIENHVKIGRHVQGITGVPQKHTVRACPLEELLSLHSVSRVDFFSLDVEGYELEVLKGIDFNRVSFGAIFVETRQNLEREIDGLLGQNGYVWERVWKTHTYSNKLYFSCNGQSI